MRRIAICVVMLGGALGVQAAGLMLYPLADPYWLRGSNAAPYHYTPGGSGIGEGIVALGQAIAAAILAIVSLVIFVSALATEWNHSRAAGDRRPTIRAWTLLGLLLLLPTTVNLLGLGIALDRRRLREAEQRAIWAERSAQFTLKSSEYRRGRWTHAQGRIWGLHLNRTGDVLGCLTSTGSYPAADILCEQWKIPGGHIEHDLDFHTTNWIFALSLGKECILLGSKLQTEVPVIEIHSLDGTGPVTEILCADGPLRIASPEYPMLAVNADGNKIATIMPLRRKGRSFGLLQVWNRATGEPLWKIPPEVRPKPLAVSPDGRRVAASFEDAIGLWNTSTGEMVLKVPCYTTYLAFSDAGDYLAAFNNGLRIFRTEDGSAVQHFVTNAPLAIRFHSDGKQVGFIKDGFEVTVGDLTSNQVRTKLTLPRSEFGYQAFVFSPDLQNLYVASGGAILRFDLFIGRELRDDSAALRDMIAPN